MNDRPPLAAADYAIAEEVIGAWCVADDKRPTRELIAEGAARARIYARIGAPFGAERGLMDDLNAERARSTALARDALGRLKAARLFVDDCIQNGHDRASLANLYGARDEIDAAIAKATA